MTSSDSSGDPKLPENNPIALALKALYGDREKQALVKFHQSGVPIKTATVPSQIIQHLAQTDSSGKELVKFYDEFGEEIKRVLDQTLKARKDELNTGISNLGLSKSGIERKDDENFKQNIGGGMGLTTVGAMIADIFLGGAATMTVTWLTGAGMIGKGMSNAGKNTSGIKAIEQDISTLQQRITYFENAKDEAFKGLDKYTESIALVPALMSHTYEHASKTYAELERYAKAHGTTADNIGEYLAKKSPEVSKAFIGMLKGEYEAADLVTIAEYGRTADITPSPEQRAFLQFVNHAVVPHMDYFEIWASKVADLEKLQAEIHKALKDKNPDIRPKLEIFGEKPVSLSGTLVLKPDLTAKAQEGKGTKRASQITKDSTTTATSILERIRNTLTNDGLDIQAKHQQARQDAVTTIEQFNGFFTGIEAALKEVDKQLKKVTSDRDDVEDKWDRAESLETRKKILEHRNPEKTHLHHRAFSVLSEVGRTALEAGADFILGIHGAPPIVGAASRVVSHDIRGLGAKIRDDVEHELQSQSLSLRRRQDPTALRASLDALDEEVKKLSENKEGAVPDNAIKCYQGQYEEEQIK